MLLFVLLTLHGCTNHIARNAGSAAASGATPHRLQVEHFTLAAYEVPAPAADPGEKLRVYLGGDGQAFRTRRQVALDPTPREDLALQLLLATSGPAYYLARPCYHGGSGATCSPLLWTSQRYSPAVVDALAEAVDQLVARHPQRELELIGYSGGGVLALLVAQRLPQAVRVVSLAAPLDTAAWTELHGYSPLTGSINPADIAIWRDGLRQYHLSGTQDGNVPPSSRARFCARLHGANRCEAVLDFDHTCCWLNVWPHLLRWLDEPASAMEGAPAGLVLIAE